MRRRGAVLIGIGALHGILLFAGDVVAVYGLLVVLFAVPLVATGPRPLWWIAGGGLLGVLVAGATELLVVTGGVTVWDFVLSPTYPLATWQRLIDWTLVGFAAQTVRVCASVAIGALAARHRLLEDVGDHARLLRRAAVGGLLVAVVGGSPLALATVGGWEPGTGAVAVIGALHALTGYAGGAGYAALAAVVVLALRDPQQPPRAGPLALGQRSLTAYLLHSVVFVLLFTRLHAGLGDDVGVAQASAIAVATWLVLLAGAVAMDRAGVRGPAEVALRWLTYGRRPGARPVPG